jgi:deoxyhypusine synthase
MSDRHSHGEPHAVRDLNDGIEDKLVPLAALDPLKIGNFDELVTAMSRTAFGGRALGEACDVLTEMTEDPECLVVATFSGAMTVAKMGIVIVRMIEAGMIHAVISTGALMAHGLSEAVGLTHYKHNPNVPDEELFEKGYNRVYDTLEMEKNLNTIDEFVRLTPWPHRRYLSGDTTGFARTSRLTP